MATTTTTVPSSTNQNPTQIVHALHTAQLTYAKVIADQILANQSSAAWAIDMTKIQTAEQMLAAIDLALPVFEGEL